MLEEPKVFLNEKGIIELVYATHMTLERQERLQREAIDLATKLEDEGRRVILLNDFTHEKKVDPAAKLIARESIKDFKFDKMAGIGASPFIRNITNMIATIAGKGNIAKHFKTREEAEQWLLQE